ncbi:MAG: hypothetical protein U0904_08170, partial [Candidatus Nanopelagicales bacterium]|nr:hypothetical protein [Candidatus Nanopelagicales bacterium]
MCAWVAIEFGFDQRIVGAASNAARCLSEREGVAILPLVGFEVHHDGSGRTDLALFTRQAPGRLCRYGNAEFAIAGDDTVEVDLTSAAPRVAGVFHQVASATLPLSLARLGTPVLVSSMVGRSGELRLLFPVPDQTSLVVAVDSLAELGVGGQVLASISHCAPLLTSGGSLRIGIDYLPERDRLSERIGIEVVIDASHYDVFGPVSRLGVRDETVERMRELVLSLPRVREREVAHPLFPALKVPNRVDTVAMTHFSLSWPTGQIDRVILKSYILAASRQLGTPEAMADAEAEVAAREAGRSWTSQLAWAGSQLPLLRPGRAAESEVARWRAAVAADHPGMFERRLRSAGLRNEQALVAVSDRPSGLYAETAPWWPWFERVRSAYANLGSSDEGVANDGQWLESAEAQLPPGASRGLPFAAALAPVVTQGWTLFCNDHSDLVGSLRPTAADDLRLMLLARLGEACGKALRSLLGPMPVPGLGGGSPSRPEFDRAQYAALCRFLHRTTLRPLTDPFPVLAHDL